MSFTRNLFSTIATLAVAVGATQAQADPIADFYKGKQISLQVGFGAGGGYDTTARIFARHFGKYVPGKPNVVVQNVPGAGSLKLEACQSALQCGAQKRHCYWDSVAVDYDCPALR